MEPVIVCYQKTNSSLYGTPIYTDISDKLYELAIMSTSVSVFSKNTVATPNGTIVNNRYLFFTLFFDWLTENFGNTLPLNIYCGVHLATTRSFQPGTITAQDGSQISYQLNPYWTYNTNGTAWSVILNGMSYAAVKLQWSHLIEERFD